MNHKCKRCGRCCIEVGRTFWKSGNLEPDRPFGNIEELNARAKNGDHEDGDLPCEMLVFKKGKAVCLIESTYGREAKPIVCRQYPEDDEMCFAETAFAAEAGS